MKLLVIGGTGGTGRELIKQAVAEGHDVSARLMCRIFASRVVYGVVSKT